eukprot:gene8510-biopygen10654
MTRRQRLATRRSGQQGHARLVHLLRVHQMEQRNMATASVRTKSSASATFRCPLRASHRPVQTAINGGGEGGAATDTACALARPKADACRGLVEEVEHVVWEKSEEERKNVYMGEERGEGPDPVADRWTSGCSSREEKQLFGLGGAGVAGAQARHGRAGQACVEQRVSAGVFWQDKAIFAGHAGQASPGTIGGCGMPVQAPHGGSTAETSPRPPQPLPGTPACGESPQAGLWHGDDSVAVTRATAVHVLLTGLHCSRTFSRCRIDVLFPHPRFPPSQVPTMCTAPGRDDAEHIPARLRFEFKGAGASSTLGGTAGNAGRPRAR